MTDAGEDDPHHVERQARHSRLAASEVFAEGKQRDGGDLEALQPEGNADHREAADQARELACVETETGRCLSEPGFVCT